MGSSSFCRAAGRLVVVDDFDVIGSILSPAETDAPLHVDTDALGALPVAFEGLQVIARGHAEILQEPSSMEVEQLPPGRPFDRSKASDVLIVEERLGILAPERPDHGDMVLRVTS